MAFLWKQFYKIAFLQTRNTLNKKWCDGLAETRDETNKFDMVYDSRNNIPH